MASSTSRGLSYETVKDVADRLVASDKPVAQITYRDILAQTGTGSLETIGHHLRRYRLEYIETLAEDDVDPAELDDLLDPIRAIVVRKVSKVNERRDLEQAGEREQARTVADNLAFAEARNKELEEELAGVSDDNRMLKEQATATMSRIAELQGKLDEARERFDSFASRLFPQPGEIGPDAIKAPNADTIPAPSTAGVLGPHQTDQQSSRESDGTATGAE